MKMKKNILAVAVLSAICGFAQADDVSNTTAAGSVDIFQIGTTAEDNSAAGAGTLTITSPATNEVNLVQGNVADNLITIDQSAATTSKANLFINANNVNDANFANSYGVGDRVAGHITDVTLSEAGSVGASYDGTKELSGSLNTISLTQAADAEVANISVEGSGNSLTFSQTGVGVILNASIHATNATYVVTQ